MKLTPIVPKRCPDPFDDPARLLLKLDGSRGLADTIEGRMLSTATDSSGSNACWRACPPLSCSAARSWLWPRTGDRCSIRGGSAGNILCRRLPGVEQI